MANGIVNLETVWHRQLSGDVLVRNIQINGWSQPNIKLLQFSQNGRLFGQVSGTTVTLYRSINPDGTFTASEAVLEGTGAENALITLSEQNSSGLGTSYLRYTGSGNFDIVFTFASEQDVLNQIPSDQEQLVYPVLSKLLSQPGRLQDALNETMLRINEGLITNIQRNGLGIFCLDNGEMPTTEMFKLDALGRFEMAIISNPEQLRRLQVWRTLQEMAEKFIGRDPFSMDVAKLYTEKADEELRRLRLRIDFEADRKQDGSTKVSSNNYIPRIG